VPHFERRRLEVVVSPVDIGDRQLRQVGIRNLIEATHHDGDKLAAIGPAAARERFDATSPAKLMLDVLRTELVDAERTLSLQQPEVRGIDRDQPCAALAADRAFALDCALAQIGRDVIAHRAAVAAARVDTFHDCSP
jgi:hypothetical protein